MKSILFTLFVILATVSLAHGQTLYYSSVGMESSVRWTHTEANYLTDIDSLESYLGDIRFYVTKGFNGETLLGCEESDMYILRGNNDWVQWGFKFNNIDNAGKIQIHQVSCESEDRWGISIQADFDTTLRRHWQWQADFNLQRPADNPLGFQHIGVIIHVADDTDDFNAKISNLEDVPEDLSGPICGLGLGILCDTNTSSENSQELPKAISLAQNYPNPFNPQTTITYQIDNPQHVRLDLFNAQGQRIQTLVEGMRPAGQHSVRFDASGLPSGVYIYRVQTNEKMLTRKMMLVR